MTRPLLLDLFCGAGGAAVGYHRAGFDVVGVDNQPQPRYPFEFIEYDAMQVLQNLAEYPGQGWAAIHASPPCQDHMRVGQHPSHGTGWLLDATRARLVKTGLPWVIENVPGAPMRVDFKLCGCMFGLAIHDGQLVRERWFETSWRGFDLRSPCHHTKPAVSVVGGGTPSWVRARLGRNITANDRRALLGTPWMTRDECSQAIPPAYTEYIGRALLDHLEVAA